jgi:hypothetical protein
MNNFCGYHNQLKSELEHLIGQNNFSIEQYKFLLHLTYEILKEFEFARLQVGGGKPRRLMLTMYSL